MGASSSSDNNSDDYFPSYDRQYSISSDSEHSLFDDLDHSAEEMPTTMKTSDKESLSSAHSRRGSLSEGIDDSLSSSYEDDDMIYLESDSELNNPAFSENGSEAYRGELIHEAQTGIEKPEAQVNTTLGEAFQHILDHTEGLQQSEAITEFFKDLSLELMQTPFPKKLVNYLYSLNATVRVEEVQKIMTSILSMTDKHSLEKFLCTYLCKISTDDRENDDLIAYLDTRSFHAHLDKATHLDIKDLVKALQRGVLEQLCHVVQCSQSSVLDMQENCQELKKRLTSYEWVSRLSHVRVEVDRLLKHKGLSVCLLEKIGLDRALVEHLSATDFRKLLSYYGIFKREVSDSRKHRVITFKAASLSLNDVLKNPDLVKLFQRNDEFRFLCTECFYVDASTDEMWSSKNVAIRAPKIIVKGHCSIDLSGTDGVDGKSIDGGKSKADNGQKSDTSHHGTGAHGHNGEHGTPGRSGGNMLVCADEIINSEQLCIRSFGGDGGDGQDGGDGSDGVAKKSASDDLGSWPKNFARFVGRTTWKSQQKNIRYMDSSGFQIKRHIKASTFAHYVYSKHSNGVQVLFATVDDFFHRYGFLLSLSVDGYSADGGNAGKGGRGGGGGKAGVIDIVKFDGYPNSHHNIMMERQNGEDGRPGKAGKPGKREITDRQPDHLYVDGAGPWGTTEAHHVFVDIKAWEHSSKTGELGSGRYYCNCKVSSMLKNKSVNNDYVGFFRATRSSECPTRHNRKALDGNVKNQDEITATTSMKAIDTAAVNMEYQLFANQTLALQDRSALLQSLEQLEHKLRNELQELETVHEQQYHKQRRRANYQSTASSLDTVEVKPASQRIEMKEAIPFEPDKLDSVVRDNSLISPEDIEFFKSDANTIQDKYAKIESIVKGELHALQQQMKNESGAEDQDTSRFHMLWRSKKLSSSSSNCICRLLDALLVPIVHVMHFEHVQAVDNAIKFLNNVHSKCHSKFRDEMDRVKETIDPLLFKQYRWCILAEIHFKYTANTSDTNLVVYQSKAVTLHQKLIELTNIEELKTFACSLDEGRDIHPYSECLPSYSTSCEENLPLGISTQKALELLMLFINDINSDVVYIPDILSAVQEEYVTFHSTISDSDLQFIMTMLQDKLLHLIDKTHLEDIFCDGLLSSLKGNLLRKGHFVSYNGQTYQLDDINRQIDPITIICTKESQIVVKVYTAQDRVTVNGKSIDFPNNELLVSPLSVDAMWSQLQKTVMKGRVVITDDKCLEDAITLPHGVHDDYRQQLISILREARSAQDIPYDVFSFYLPTQWVEQLILYAVRTQYQDNDPNFVADVQQAINGLSCCVDKSLYYTFYNQFLSSKNDNPHCTMDILAVLKLLKSIFIDRQVCTVVTQKGIALAWPHVSADAVFTELQEFRLIDDVGAFLAYVATDTIQTFCRAYNLSPVYLSNIHSMQQYLDSLSDKELTFWDHKLHEILMRLELQDIIEGDVDHSVYDEMLMYAQMLVRHHGNDLVSKLMQALKSKTDKVCAASLLELFRKCAYKTWIFEVVIEELNTPYTLTTIIRRLQAYDWESVFSKPRRAVDIIASIKLQFSEEIWPKLDAITTILNDIKDIENQEQYSKLEELNDPEMLLVQVPICDYDKNDIKEWTEAFKKSASQFKHQAFFEHPLFAEAFAVIRRGITIFYDTEKGKKGVTPRDNQMVASLLFLQNLSVQEGASQGTRLMQQISTGEGKTMIICMTAIFKALLGEKADIVTSSSVLATRDAAEQKSLYNLFDISVSHCCHEELTKRREAYECDIVYGDIGSFQRDILETNFYGRMIRTNHDFDNVFIDEVDSMLVDKGETMLYLPHPLPDLNALHDIYLEIWSFVNAQDFLGFPDEQNQLHDYLRHKLFGGLQANAFTAIQDISEEQSADIHRSCIEVGLINDDDHCLTTDNITAIIDKVNSIRSVPQCSRQEIILIIQEHLESIPVIQEVPIALHPFVRRSLRAWIESAVNAKYFRPNKEYIIDIDRRESAGNRYPKIIIMDNETGVEQESSEWGSGLHQFLQLKHFLRLSTESLKAVYMSNISFFTPRYTNIMGVSGTLGSNAEHNLFNKLYKDTKIVVLPTNKPSQLQIDVPQCCSTKESWEQAIDVDVREKHQQGRVVLLICEDVERAKYLNDHFRQRYPKMDMKLYISSHQQKLEESGENRPGQLIIATNLAGRGTDIKLSEEVKLNGGLHVCLSYLPPNVRVEQQAYGRAARSGDPGSCKLIFCDKEGDLSYAIRKRDVHEAQRIAEIEADYYHNIKFQEELFKLFSDQYEIIKIEQEDKPQGRPVLDNCLDHWAFFLDEYTDAIESIPNKASRATRVLEKDRIRQAFQKKVKYQAFERVTLSPARMMQKGHTYMKQAVKVGHKYKATGNKVDYEEAIKAYKEAIKQNPTDPFARYYKAAAKLNRAFRNKNTTFDSGNSHRRDFKQALYQLIPLFQDKIKKCQAQMTALKLANRYQDQSLTAGVQYYNEQKQHEIEVYHQYLDSIQDIIGREITPNTLDHADWKEETVPVFKTVKKIFSLKECRISPSPRYLPRLSVLLEREASYHTYQSEIKKTVGLLLRHSPVERDDFKKVFPDKCHFWDQLKRHHLLTHLSETPEEKVGYWNPSVDTKRVKFDRWDRITSESFDWIKLLSSSLKESLIWCLKTKRVLNSHGQLIDLDLSKPLNLPAEYTPHYKQIKDTLWNHSIYRFVLDHLCDCVIIDMEQDLASKRSSDAALPHQHSPTAVSQTSYSVVDIIISMNPKANASCVSDIQHIQHSSSSSETDTQLLDMKSKSDVSVFSLANHFPSEALNHELSKQLQYHNLRVTKVSGDGLNCMIHAMIQHAKKDYQTSYFEEAETIREKLHKCTKMSGMLHPDDHYAEAILMLVNDLCCATIKVQVVSVVIASSDGPIIYGGTRDKRYSTGRHVVIWQQGIHYVSIVHHFDLVQSIYRCPVTDSDETETISDEEPKLTQHQLDTLVELHLVKKRKKSHYVICAGLGKIERTLQSVKSLSHQDKEKVREFLRLKLEIDFKTLKHSPRQILKDQHRRLYDDLCQYAVIKPVKMKRKAEDIEDVCNDKFGYKGLLKDGRPYFDIALLSMYLQEMKIDELSESQQRKLVTYLQDHSIIYSWWSRICINEFTTEHSAALRSSIFLCSKQQDGVEKYLKLVIRLKENVSAIISILKNQQSTILELETPEITLRRLPDLNEDSLQDKGDVVGWFSDNQCDLMIDLAEQKWSWKTITTAIGAIALGVAQIALGAVLLLTTAGTGSFICNGLISEGVSDMMFGIEGLVKGHCNWSQYWQNKKMSMAITVATAGVGALFARGKEASKYAFKAFGNANKSLVKQTAQLTGKSMNKVMTKQVLKKIGKKVVGAVADAGISLATDAMVSQMSGAINSMSECIIECIDTLCQNEDLKRKMSKYLQQQNLQTAGKYLHQITMRALQRQTFLELWDAIEDGAKTGLDVLTQAHARAGSHLKMRGSSLKGKTVMKGISYVSRFAPLATETVKAGLVSAKMVKVKNALIEDLERAIDSDQKQEQIQSDKSREKQIQEMVDEELSAIKRHLRDEMSQRSQKVVKIGLQIVGQEMKNKLIKVGKEHVLFPLKEHMDLNQLKHCEQKLVSAKLDENRSKIKKYEIKLQKLMRRTRSPAVFARMIKHHNALLGPAFALPALEMLVTRPIQIVTETKDGKLEPLLNVAHHAEGSVLQIKFVPGKDGSPGHYYFGDQKFTPQQHGNNCLIQAVLTGSGKSHMDPGEVRNYIAQACREPKHPCHHYIKSGIARNYVTIGLVGGAVKHKRGKFSGKAEWYPHMDVFLQNEWYSHPENAQKSGKNLQDWKRLGGEQTLIDLGLHRCHMVSEKSIHQMLEHAMKRNNINLATINKIIDALLPPFEKIRDGSSAFGEGNSQRAFLETCDNRECRAAYEVQRRQASQFVNKLAAGRATNEDKIELATNLNNSPANVSFGHARNNMSTSKYLDYNPASPRSIYLYNELHKIQGFIPQKEGYEDRPSSYFTDPRRQYM